MPDQLIRSSPIKPFAFKEWSLICDALMEGEQSVILRKGGIAEKRRGFGFEHDSFFLLPTHYHAQREETLFDASKPIRWESKEKADAGKEAIFVPAAATLSLAMELTDWAQVEALHGLHFWKEETLHARFAYGQANCLHLAVVRVYQVKPVIELPDSPQFRGCKSWVNLAQNDLPLFALQPVLSDAEHARRLQKIQQMIQTA